MTEADGGELHILDYWRILVKRQWIVYTCLAVTVTTVMLRSLLMEPVYTATATLQIERMNPKVLPFQSVTDDGGDFFYGFYETQYGLITSRRVAREVIRKLDLANHPEYKIEEPSRVASGLTSADVVEGARISRFLANLSVAPVNNSRLVNVSFSSHDRALTARAANAVAETYMEFNARSTYNTTEQASSSLATQVASLQKEIEEKETRLQDYARKNGITPVGENQDITLKNLTDLSKAWTEARAVRIEKEARLDALREAKPSEVDEVAASRVIGDLSAKSVELGRRQAELTEKYGPEWPELQRVRGEMREIDGRLEAERSKVYEQVLGSALADYRAAKKEEDYLASSLDSLKKQSQDLGLKEIEYKTLKGEIDNRRQTLASLQRRQSEASSSAGLNDLASSNVRIVDRAEVPLGASKPQLRVNFLLSLVSGLGLGLGLAFLFEFLDKSVKSGEDVLAVTALPALGVIPISRPSDARLRLVKTNGGHDASEGRKVGQITHENPGSRISEAIREVRTTLLVSRPGGPPRTILVTSALPGEGKTSVACNLAISLAQPGRRVLLVDADMRKPRLSWIFGLADGPGLSCLLSSTDGGAPAIRRTVVDGLDLLDSGPPPPNPADLLGSEHFNEIGASLCAMGYDHIVFDSPPVLAVADACTMASRMDSVVLVVWAGVTGKDALAHAVGRLRQVKAKVTGTVLNKAERGDRYYGRYAYRYSSRRESPEEGEEQAAPPAEISGQGV
ncbi:MAG TPA: polysaccharide biosynthesis tyrosine autokinase [Candidatus Saccharimonadales bacterium]|nr:polysaccharide biosynthesis tyrosine autokinase [Candidatus Saccharimonadales bacterium]